MEKLISLLWQENERKEKADQLSPQMSRKADQFPFEKKIRMEKS
jgi:hypothetical protein